ncbi:MAG: hypothetical protein HYY16_18450 [Planctomycetes bacterium]|nr:hypothetical protein [Planctomycetota bacterium]
MSDMKGLILGEIALREKILTEEQLDDCLQQQIDERNARPLGEIMIAKGYVDREGLKALLEVQRVAFEQFQQTAQYARLFGKIAMAKGFVTEAKLNEAIRAQIRKHARGLKSKIGQVMIELGFIDIQQFWEIIHAQGDFTCGTCRRLIEKPWFRSDTVVCEHCSAPAFSVSPEKAGPKPTKRHKRPM